MASMRWWCLWAVFNFFFLSWLFDWSRLAKEWAAQAKVTVRENKQKALVVEIQRHRVVKRNHSLPQEGPFGPFWTMDRLRNGGSVRIAAAGLSRSGSTWQFNALRILLQHAAKALGKPENSVVSAHGHSVDELQSCLSARVCIAKVHEFLPRVLSQVDAVFVTHRDPRDVLLSSAQKIDACLLAGKQPLEAAFRSYAAWVPHACHDMRYEDMATGGAARELLAMATKLGVAQVVNLIDVAAQLGQVTHRAEPNEKQQQQTGLMPGHLTHLTTDPGAHLVFEDAVARGAFSKKCNLTREIELINAGFGGWLAKEGYPLPPPSATLPPLPPPRQRSQPPGASPAQESEQAALERAELSLLAHRVAWRGAELTNWYVDALPERAWLMRDELAAQAQDAVTQRCPLSSSWSTMLDRSGVWSYSVPGGKAGSNMHAPQQRVGAPQPGPAQKPPPARPEARGGRDLRKAMAEQASNAKAQASKAARAARHAKPRPEEAVDPDADKEVDRMGRPRLKPSFMLIGTPRSGTTVLYDSLTSNDPNVVPAATKEINYFNSIGWELKPAKWYFSQYKRKRSDAQLTGDGSCTSVLCPRAAARVAERAPSITRFLLCVRDEVRRLQSHYRMCKQNEQMEAEGKFEGQKKARPNRLPPLPPLAGLVRTELERIRACDTRHAALPLERRFAECYVNQTATCNFSAALLPASLHNANRPGCSSLLTGSMYALQLAPWLERFQPKQFLLVQKSDLENKPRVTLENVSGFLGSAHQYRAAAQIKGGATKKPKHRTFNGDAELPPALLTELTDFFAPHRQRLAELLKTKGLMMTRFTEGTQATYTLKG